jgi:hypothetical protein
LIDEVGDVEVFDVEVASSLATAGFAILLQFHGALIVSIHHIVDDLEILVFNESAGPQDLGNNIVVRDQFSFS